MERRAGIRRGHRRRQRNALGEDRALKPVPVDPFLEVDPWRLLNAEPYPRSARHPVVEIELRVGVLDAKDEAVAGDARRGDGSALPRDVRRDAERHDVRDLAGDVDVAALNVERVAADAVAVDVGDLRIRLVGERREQRHADPDRRRVVGRRIPRRGSDLRERRTDGTEHGQKRDPDGLSFHGATVT